MKINTQAVSSFIISLETQHTGHDLQESGSSKQGGGGGEGEGEGEGLERGI